MYCSLCKHPVANSTKFCTNCGASLAQNPPVKDYIGNTELNANKSEQITPDYKTEIPSYKAPSYNAPNYGTASEQQTNTPPAYTPPTYNDNAQAQRPAQTYVPPTYEPPTYGAPTPQQSYQRPAPTYEPPEYNAQGTQNTAINQRPAPTYQPPSYGAQAPANEQDFSAAADNLLPFETAKPPAQQYQYGANNAQNTAGYNYNAPPPIKKKTNGCLIAIVVVLALLVFSVVTIFVLAYYFLGESDDYYYEYETSDNYDYDSDDNSTGVYGDDLGLTDLRDYYTSPKGDGSDIHTIMMYMIGSDLESEGGAASFDIDEMLDATLTNNVRIALMTGGATYWYNERISGDTCQYWLIQHGQLILMEERVGLVSMVESETLSDFINFSAGNFPADRYHLIMWNHGGGTMGGFGYDEHFPYDYLTLYDIESALMNTNVKFDMIGFDACLMATAETAFMLEPYADYLIASEETEPGTGWYYTDWLTALANDPSMPTLDMAVNIIDDYVEVTHEEQSRPDCTLSVIELRQMPYTYAMLTDYFENATIEKHENEFEEIASALSDVKDFGEGDYDQIDVIDFVNNTDVEGGAELVAAINSAVKYYRNSHYIDDAYGMAMYFPYDHIDYYSEINDVLEDIGYTDEYTEFFDVFMSAMYGGQINAHGGFDSGYDDYTAEEWYDSDTATTYEENYDSTLSEDLYIEDKGDYYALSLTDEQWDEITTIELQVLLDDGVSYQDLGSDNVYEFDDDGDLIVDFDYTWVALDGNVVAFYAEEEFDDGYEWYTYGYVPAVLNEDEYIEIIVYWDNENPYGYVAGYRKYTEAGQPAGKGLFDLQAGDSLEWVFDYYTYDGYFEDTYVVGDAYIVPSYEIDVSYEYVGDWDSLIYFVLTDIYNNEYYTESVIYYD